MNDKDKIHRLTKALECLVFTKEYKDKHGKDAKYIKARKQAWEIADNTLELIKESYER